MLALVWLLPALYGFGFIGHRLASSLAWELIPADIKETCLGIPNTPSGRSRFIKLACRADYIKHKDGMQWAMPLHYYNSHDHPPLTCECAAEIKRRSKRQPNLVTAVQFYKMRLERATRKQPLTQKQQVHILSFFVHFLTDLHQPLHVNSRMKGGNRLKIRFAGRKTTLHALWDSKMLQMSVNRHGHSRIRKMLLKRVKLLRPVSTLNKSISNWAAQTNAANCMTVWNGLTEHDLSRRYYAKNLPILLDFIALAAIRVADTISTVCM